MTCVKETLSKQLKQEIHHREVNESTIQQIEDAVKEKLIETFINLQDDYEYKEYLRYKQYENAVTQPLISNGEYQSQHYRH